MNAVVNSQLPTLLKKHEQKILEDWLDNQLSAITLRRDLLNEKELREQSQEFLNLFVVAIQQKNLNEIDSPAYSLLREFLRELSSTRAQLGFSPSETAIFILSLKQSLFTYITQDKQVSAQSLLEEIWAITTLIDKLSLYTIEQYQQTREEIINRQQQDMLELSTPVAKLWDGILVLPLIGTLDSARTQQVMENLLQKIVETNSIISIIDIAGIPMVDTLVAQHLIKTISAARLMGAECIISGIRPQIAQTIVHLGISLQDVVTKATLSDAVSYAINRAGFTVARMQKTV